MDWSVFGMNIASTEGKLWTFSSTSMPCTACLSAQSTTTCSPAHRTTDGFLSGTLASRSTEVSEWKSWVQYSHDNWAAVRVEIKKIQSDVKYFRELTQTLVTVTMINWRKHREKQRALFTDYIVQGFNCYQLLIYGIQTLEGKKTS